MRESACLKYTLSAQATKKVLAKHHKPARSFLAKELKPL